MIQEAMHGNPIFKLKLKKCKMGIKRGRFLSEENSGFSMSRGRLLQ
jgi:hypothetical protein